MITKRVGRNEGFFWVGMGVFICLLAARNDLGSFREPGSGFIAFGAGLFLAAIGLIMLSITFRAKRAHAPGDGEDRVLGFGSVPWFRILYTLGLLLAYAVLLDPLGYILTTWLVMWGLFYDRVRKNWFSSFLVALLTTAIFYLFFDLLLGLRFPPGIFH